MYSLTESSIVDSMVFNLNADCTIEEPFSNMSMFDSAGRSTKVAGMLVPGTPQRLEP